MSESEVDLSSEQLQQQQRCLLDLPPELLSIVLQHASPASRHAHTIDIHNASVASMRHPRPALFAQHPARIVLDRQQWAAALRSTCRKFSALLSPPGACRLTNVWPSHLGDDVRTGEGHPHSTRAAGNHKWIEEDVTLDEFVPTILAYEVKPHRHDSECIGAFSHSMLPWAGGDGGEDALTWYAAPHRDDFSFRTKMFSFLRHGAIEHYNKVKLAPNAWHLIEVHLTRSIAAYWIDGTFVAAAVLGRATEGFRRTEPGRFGFVTYGEHRGYCWRNAVILKPGVHDLKQHKFGAD